MKEPLTIFEVSFASSFVRSFFSIHSLSSLSLSYFFSDAIIDFVYAAWLNGGMQCNWVKFSRLAEVFGGCHFSMIRIPYVCARHDRVDETENLQANMHDRSCGKHNIAVLLMRNVNMSSCVWSRREKWWESEWLQNPLAGLQKKWNATKIKWDHLSNYSYLCKCPIPEMCIRLMQLK